MSGSVSTNASSKISQFGLYRTIDSRTEEFLKLSKKRQIRQGCACAAVSTAITVTIVVGFLLIYEYSIVPHNRKLNAKQTWQTFTSESEEDISFERKMSKAEISMIPKTSPIQPGLLQALSRNKFNMKHKLFGAKSTPFNGDTTTASAYKHFKITEFKPRFTKNKEYNTTPAFSFTPTKPNMQTKVKPNSGYDSNFIKKYINKMIEKHIKSYKSQVVGRSDLKGKAASTTTEKTIFNVISLKRRKHTSTEAQIIDSCTCQWNLNQILKKIMKCVMNLESHGNPQLCANCKSKPKPQAVEMSSNIMNLNTHRAIYDNNIEINTYKPNYDNNMETKTVTTTYEITMPLYTSEEPYSTTSEAQTRNYPSQYINTLNLDRKKKVQQEMQYNDYGFIPTEKVRKLFNATNVLLPKQILINSLPDKHCTFFKDYISRLQKNRMYQSQGSELSDNHEIIQPDDIKLANSFYSKMLNLAGEQKDLEQISKHVNKPSPRPILIDLSNKIFGQTSSQAQNYNELLKSNDQNIKTQETQTLKQDDTLLSEFERHYKQIQSQKPSVSTTGSFEEFTLTGNKNKASFAVNSKAKKVKSLFEEDTETVQKIKPKIKTQEQHFQGIQESIADEENNLLDVDDDTDGNILITQSKNPHKNKLAASQTSLINEASKEAQQPEFIMNKPKNEEFTTNTFETTEKQYKWYKTHPAKNENGKAEDENDFFDKLTKKFNSAEESSVEKRNHDALDQESHIYDARKNRHRKPQSVYSPTLLPSITRPSYLEMIRSHRFQPNDQDYDTDVNRYYDNDYAN